MKRRKSDENEDSDKTRILSPYSKKSFIGKKVCGEKKGKSLLLDLNNLVLPPKKCKSKCLVDSLTIFVARVFRDTSKNTKCPSQRLTLSIATRLLT